MPLLKLQTNATISQEKQQALLAALSKAVAQTIGKPEQYVMVTLGTPDMLMAGKPGDAAFVDIRSIGGLSGKVNQQLSQKVCQLLKDSFAIPSERVYLNFTDVPASDWGWNGETFG
jgi:phenylpyruvate tautomerase